MVALMLKSFAKVVETDRVVERECDNLQKICDQGKKLSYPLSSKENANTGAMKRKQPAKRQMRPIESVGRCTWVLATMILKHALSVI